MMSAIIISPTDLGFRTGKILYGLGNVLESQGRFQESLRFHQRCYEQFSKVLGNNHHRFGDICHKMAGHCIRLHHFQEAEYGNLHAHLPERYKS